MAPARPPDSLAHNLAPAQTKMSRFDEIFLCNDGVVVWMLRCLEVLRGDGFQGVGKPGFRKL